MSEGTSFILTENDKSWDEGVTLENFTHSVDSSFPETLYMSVGDQTTQYYSVLEQSEDEILNNISDITIDPMKDLNVTIVPDQHEEIVVDPNDSAMIYTVKGSDSLFGLQEVQDNEGNIHKYQFEVHQNENGEFEAIPGTFQLVQFQSDEEEEEEQAVEEQKEEIEENLEENDLKGHQIFLTEDSFGNVEYIEENLKMEQEYDEEENEQWTSEIETKEGIVNTFDGNIQEDDLPEEVEENFCTADEIPDEETNEESSTSNSADLNLETRLDIRVNPEIDINQFSHFLMNSDDLKIDSKLQQSPPSTLINKTPTKSLILCQQRKEKENFINKSPINNNRKVNPRSILKISQIAEEKHEDVYDRRFAKGKTATLRRQFENFISKTTIPEAPVRNERLPRKQKIKPVQRDNEEIIMQHVVVSSNGYIETHENGVFKDRELLVPSACILISDSDEDRKSRRKKRKRKQSVDTFVISDTEDEEIIVEETVESKAIPTKIDSDDVRRKKRLKTKTNQVNYSCDICKSQFTSMTLLKTHINFHKSNKKLSSRVSCNICKELFDTYFKLSQHKRSHKKFNKKSQLENCPSKPNNSPYTVKSTNQGKKYSCLKCSSSFSSKIFLEKHIINDCVKFKRSSEVVKKATTLKQ